MSHITNGANTWWPPIGDTVEAKPTITEFLLARIAEDERVAQDAAESVNEHATRYAADEYAYDEPLGRIWAATDYGMVRGENLDLWDCEGSETLCTTPQAAIHIARHGPARVLAECAARRVIIEQAEEATGLDADVDNDRLVGARDMKANPYCGDTILYAMAAIYADHPDYQQEWAA